MTDETKDTPTQDPRHPDDGINDAEEGTLRAQAQEYLESLQRERASFANYKRRIDQEKADFYEKSFSDHVKIFLPVIDDLERATKNAPTDLECAGWIEGIGLILQKLLNTLNCHGIKEIDVQPGAEFDPNEMEAVTHEENETFTDGQVIEVVQTGYQLKDRIIRPALVRVAK